MVGYNMDGPARDRVMKLIQEKDRIELEIREQNLVLEANHVGMNDPLIDSEGYPRGDIDVYKVRHARHRIICLQNDHKNLMKQIERGLGEVHAGFLENRSGPSANATNCTAMNGATPHPSYSNGHSTNEQSFAIIGFVQEGSPADLAGLNENDEVLQFGSINHDNFRDITQVHDIVVHSVEQQIHVRVRRGHHVLGLSVVPRRWSQPGLLGCQIRRMS